MPVPNIEQLTSKINFNGGEASIKEHISLLVFSLLKNDIRLNQLFEKLNLQTEIDESRFEIVRKIDLLFMLLYKLNDSEIELVLSEFNKLYSKGDMLWFKSKMELILSNKTVSSSSSLVPHFSPN